MFHQRRQVSVAGASVVAPTKPTLTAPATGVAVLPGVAVTVSATVTAGQVPDRVDFVLDPGGSEVVIATDSSSPYSQSWTPAQAAGDHTLVARFVYGSGHVDSDPATVTIIDIALWLLGDYVTKTGTDITVWLDQSGHGRDFSAAAGKEPTYQATGGPNSTPDVRFGGSDLLTRAGSVFSALTAADVFVVWKFDNAESGAATNTPWMFSSQGSQPYWAFTGGHVYDNTARNNDRPDIGDPTQDLTAWHVVRITSTSSEWTVTVGTQQLYTTATNTVGFADTCALGGTTLPGLVGDQAMLLILPAKASAAALTTIRAFIAAKYGALPGTA